MAPTRYMGQRRLIREGVLLKAKSGRKLRGFLCSDVLVLTEEAAKNLYRMVRLSTVPSARAFTPGSSRFHCRK